VEARDRVGVREGERDETAGPLLGGEGALGRGRRELELARVEGVDRQPALAVDRGDDAAVAAEARLLEPVAEARLDAPAHRHAAGDPLDPPRELAPRQWASLLERQRVRHAHRALRRREGRLEHVRLGHVALLRLVVD